MQITPNAQYNVAAPDSLSVRLAGFQRQRMYDRFLKETGIAAEDTLLDVGVTSDQTYASSNYIEAWYPHKAKITAAGIEDASFLRQLYPGLTFVRADGLALPFSDGSYDIVHSSAVLEHVGDFERQARFIAECARVARKSIFLTTPNRWFPIEFHTVLPLVHWLPKPTFRNLMRRTGRAFFAEESNLNLMTAKELRAAATMALNGRDFHFTVQSVALAAWPSNLLLVVRRRHRNAADEVRIVARNRIVPVRAAGKCVGVHIDAQDLAAGALHTCPPVQARPAGAQISTHAARPHHP